MGVLPTCVLMYHVCAWCSQRSAKGLGSPRTKVTDGYEPLQVMESEPWSSARAENAPNCWAPHDPLSFKITQAPDGSSPVGRVGDPSREFREEKTPRNLDLCWPVTS